MQKKTYIVENSLKEPNKKCESHDDGNLEKEFDIIITGYFRLGKATHFDVSLSTFYLSNIVNGQ